MEDGYAVYVEEEGLAERKPVKLGIIQGDSVQILDDRLASGDALIVAGHRFVAPDQKVNVVSDMEPSL